MGQSLNIGSYILFSSIEIEAPITRQRFPCKRWQKHSACDNVMSDFEASVQKGNLDYKGKRKLFKPLLTL